MDSSSFKHKIIHNHYKFVLEIASWNHFAVFVLYCKVKSLLISSRRIRECSNVFLVYLIKTRYVIGINGVHDTCSVMKIPPLKEQQRIWQLSNTDSFKIHDVNLLFQEKTNIEIIKWKYWLCFFKSAMKIKFIMI